MATLYLQKIRGRKHDANRLFVKNCRMSTVANAIKIFKPVATEITSLTGEYYEILPGFHRLLKVSNSK